MRTCGAAGQLAGKGAIVTGAASGIGRATCVEFVREGAKVALVDRRPEPMEEIRQELGSGSALPIALDVTDEAAAKSAVLEARKWLGGLDVLVNSAGVGATAAPAPVNEVGLDAWRRAIDVNLTGTFIMIKHCLPYLVANSGGAIINLASTYAVVGAAGLAPYAASKGGVLQLTRCVALEYAHAGIRANAIAPGFVDTPMLRADLEALESPREALTDIVARIPQGRLSTPRQVARVIVFLSSADAEIITGALIVADGGFTTQ